MTRSRHTGLALLLALTTAGCAADQLSSPDIAEVQDGIATLLSATATSDPAAAARGGNGLFDRLAHEIASFGGLYRNGHCAVAVVLTNMEEADHAIRVVKAALEPLVSCPDGMRVHPVKGDFTYVELVRYQAAAQELLRIDGVRATRIDYKLNRIVVYVTARRVAHQVLETLPSLGIPAAAIVFQLSSGQTRG